MPRKKTVIPDEQPMEALTAAETGAEESAGQLLESAGFSDAAPGGEDMPPAEEAPFDGAPSEPPAGEEPSGDMPPDGEPQPGDDMSGGDMAVGELPGEAPPEGEGAAHAEEPSGGDFPVGEQSPFPEAGDAAGFPQEGMGAESDDPEYGALLREMGEAGHGEAGAEEPLTLGPPPGEEPIGDVPPPEPAEPEEGLDGEASTPPRRPRGRPRRTEAAPAADPRRDRVLTIEARDEVQTPEEREAIIWHEIQNAHWTRRILTGTLDGVERTESGLTVAVVNYIVKGHENKSRSVVASRKDAMYRKRQTFYLDKDELGQPMISEGRVVQARVVAVAEKVVRVEVFGVECAILARGLSRAWVGNAAEHYHVGDRILVRVQKITGSTVEDLSITADVRSTSADTGDDLKKCVRQGRYAGRVTDVRGGVLYVRLNNGVNAIAHSCYDRRTPGKGDDVSFAVTRLDEEQGVAIGSITRIIKQNL